MQVVTVADIEKAKASGKHRYRSEERAINEAVDILINNLFTGIDIITFIQANPEAIAQAIGDRLYPKGHNVNRKRNTNV